MGQVATSIGNGNQISQSGGIGILDGVEEIASAVASGLGFIKDISINGVNIPTNNGVKRFKIILDDDREPIYIEHKSDTPFYITVSGDSIDSVTTGTGDVTFFGNVNSANVRTGNVVVENSVMGSVNVRTGDVSVHGAIHGDCTIRTGNIKKFEYPRKTPSKSLGNASNDYYRQNKMIEKKRSRRYQAYKEQDTLSDKENNAEAKTDD